MLKYFIYIGSCLVLFTNITFAQALKITSIPLAEMNIGIENGTYQVKVENLSGATMNNASIQITLPVGITYLPASLTETSSFQVRESNISNLGSPVFVANSLPNGVSYQFSIKYKGSCQAVTNQLAGTVFRNMISVTSSAGTFSHTSSAYNILYPSLTITSISPKTYTLINKATYTRSITVVNGGNGSLNEFYVSDAHPAGLQLMSVNKGALTGGNLIYLSANDFKTIGNKDGVFNSNESIVIQETLYAETCADITYTSTINAYWNLNASQCQSSTSYANVFVDFTSPALKQTATASFNTCYSTTPSPQQLQIQNTTATAANNVEVDIFNSSGTNYDPTIFSRIDVASIKYKIGSTGTLTSIVPTATEATNTTDVYSCLGAGSVGKVTLSIPNVPANQSIYVYWNTQHCCVTSCLGAKQGGWKSTVRFKDECNVASTNTITGQTPVQASMSFFTETPATISNGQKKTFGFLVSSHLNTYPTATGAYYEVFFQLPRGLVYEGVTGDLTWTSVPNTLNATSINYDAVARTITARYPLPFAFSLPKTQIDLKLKADCNEAGVVPGANSIAMSVFFVANPSCSSICKVSLACSKTVTTTLNCTGDCSEGLAFQNFTIQRSTFGRSDNNTDGFPDSTGNLDMNKVKANRVMTNDTIKAVFYGKVATSAERPTWQYGYAKSTIPLGAYLTPISGSVKIFDASANAFLNANGVTIQKTKASETGTFNMDFSLPTLISKGNTQLNGFQWENNDLVELTVFYTLSSNIGGKIQEVLVNNEFYVSDVANPTNAANKFQCGYFDETITFMGYYFFTDKSVNTTITSCSSYIDQLYYLSIGDCCSNFEGGNLFPYEYRNWGRIKEGKVVIPDGYKVLNIKLEQWITRSTNTSIYQSKTGIQPDATTGNELYFNLEKYYKTNGGTFDLGDDGFKGKLSVEIAPTCAVPTGVFQDMPWSYTFARADRLENGTTTAWMTDVPDKVRYSPTTLTITPLNPKEDGLNKTVTWTVYIKNATANSDARNAWMHIVSPTGKVKITKVTDAATNQTMSLSGDIYQLGQVNLSSTKTYYITATYSACNAESINVYAGYECAGYPVNFASFTCPIIQTTLTVDPKPAQFQVRIYNSYIDDPCSSNMQVEVEIRSVQMAAVDSLKVNFTMPANNSISYKTGTSAFQYNLSSDYRSVANPTLVAANTYSYNVPAFDTTIAKNGLVGVLDLNNNTLKVKFNVQLNSNFKAGDYFGISVDGKSPCSLVLPQINLAVDPSIKFDKDLSSGLSTGTTDSWSASWGDYDNDGFEDLYVPEYDKTKGSHLYHNNGNGTFTETNTVIANDKVSATAGTWGDYDNDGDLDLYVSTNLGAPGLLYNNQGNGTFSKVVAGDIATDDGYDHTASWIDYDNDGFLDLFVLDIMPTQFNKLYHNNGNGTFTKVNDASIVMAVSSSIGATWSDYDNDGDMDIFIPNRDKENFLYRNDGKGKFTKITTGVIVTESLGSVGSSWGDYDNDGDMDLFVANAGTKFNALYANNGNGTFNKVNSGIVVTDKGNSHGSTWADLDNDGDLDLYVTNDGGEGNFFYVNNGDGTFQKIENDLTELKQKSFGTAVADYDNDGDIDIFVANHSGQPNQLYINSRGRCSNSICFKLIGTKSNRSAIGAKVRIKATINGKTVWQMREISSQTGGGVASQNSMKAYFGLGLASQADEVIIEWPSGLLQNLGVQSAGICHEIVEQLGSTVCGAVYHDANSNCVKDSDEKGIPNARINVVSEGKTYNVQTDTAGNYHLYLSAGNYQVAQVLNTGWTTCNAAYSVQINGGGQTTCGFNFGNTPSCTSPDLVIKAGTTVLHKGFENNFIISYENQGVGEASNVKIEVTFPQHVSVQNSKTAWSSFVGNTYTWILPSVPAFGEGMIEVITKTNITSTVGEELTTNFTISNSTNECNNTNNSFQYKGIVVGAVDPNDIWVSETEIDNLDKPLTYVIRFQNVGNYPATFVRISDYIPSSLDLSTIEMVNASHHVTSISTEGRLVQWQFDHINLVDSTTDEAASHGFIEFKIKPSNSLVHGNVILNKASIIFDFDGAIATNTVKTVYYIPDERVVEVYPNPVSSDAVLKFKGDLSSTFSFTLFSCIGTRIAQESNIENNEVKLKVWNLKAGVYLYQLKDQNGKLMTKGRVIVW